MLPNRWKAFRFISYFHVAAVGIVAIFLGYSYMRYASGGFGDRLGLTIFILLTALLLSNGLLSLHLVEKCYPDKQPGKLFRIGAILVIIPAIIFYLLLFATCLYRIFAGMRDAEGILWISIMLFICSSGVYICWQQVVLEKLIYRNQELQINSFLEEPMH